MPIVMTAFKWYDMHIKHYQIPAFHPLAVVLKDRTARKVPD